MATLTRTILSRSPNALLAHIAQLKLKYSDHRLLFALSPNLSASDLSKLIAALTTFSVHGSVGCLAAPLPATDTNTLTACSLALFDRTTSRLFRSNIPGIEDPQVGRWHAFRKPFDPQSENVVIPQRRDVDWNDVWSRTHGDDTLPPDLQDYSPSSIFFFSDRAFQGLSRSLRQFPTALKMGLVATSTPFITGRPVTLLKDDRIYGTGAVGIALDDNLKAACTVDFLNAIPMASPMKITRCEGNMVNEINNENPTRLLLSVIRQHGGTGFKTSPLLKEEDRFSLATLRNGMVDRMYKITAGDPTRGSLSLDAQGSPSVGTDVQFYIHSSDKMLGIPDRLLHTSSGRTKKIAFMASSDAEPWASETLDSENGVRVLDDVFLAASENGFTLSRPDESDWACKLMGSVACVEWSQR